MSVIDDLLQEADYMDMVRNLKKDPFTISEEMTAAKADAIHMAMGISGGAGGLLDAIKKATIYNKPLDINNVIEELGDLEFYMEGLRQSLELSREEILRENFNKLSVRYAGLQYSDSAAQLRADKA